MKKIKLMEVNHKIVIEEPEKQSFYDFVNEIATESIFGTNLFGFIPVLGAFFQMMDRIMLKEKAKDFIKSYHKEANS